MILSDRNTLIQIRQYDDIRTSVPKSIILQDKDAGTQSMSFRFFSFVVTSPTKGNIIQFSRLQFYADDGSIFQYGTFSADYNNRNGDVTIGPYGGEEIENALQSSMAINNKKLCGKIDLSPTYFNIDLKSPRLDLKRYKNFRFYNSWDTGQYKSRALNSFELYVSYDGKQWYEAIGKEDGKNVIGDRSNYSIRYDGVVKVKF